MVLDFYLLAGRWKIKFNRLRIFLLRHYKSCFDFYEIFWMTIFPTKDLAYNMVVFHFQMISYLLMWWETWYTITCIIQQGSTIISLSSFCLVWFYFLRYSFIYWVAMTNSLSSSWNFKYLIKLFFSSLHCNELPQVSSILYMLFGKWSRVLGNVWGHTLSSL